MLLGNLKGPCHISHQGHGISSAYVFAARARQPLSVLLLCLFASYEQGTSLRPWKLAVLLAVCMHRGVRAKYARPSCSVKNRPCQHRWQNEMCRDIPFPSRTCLCRKSAVLLGYRAQLGNGLHTASLRSFLPHSEWHCVWENAFF